MIFRLNKKKKQKKQISYYWSSKMWTYRQKLPCSWTPTFFMVKSTWWWNHQVSPGWLVKSQVSRRFHSSIPSCWHFLFFLNASIPQKDPKRASTMADSLLGRTSSWTSSVSFSQRTESSVGDCAGTEGGSSFHWFNGNRNRLIGGTHSIYFGPRKIWSICY